jgi:TPR repeat protein
VALAADALWVDAPGSGALALDLDTGAILESLPSLEHPEREDFATYGDYLASERRKLQEPAEAKVLADLRRRAGAGEAEAMFQLGKRLAPFDQEPDGLSPSILWFLEAARRGHTGAMVELAAFYETGRGVPRDSAEARRWLERGTALGDEKAGQALQVLFPR